MVDVPLTEFNCLFDQTRTHARIRLLQYNLAV